MGEHPQSVSLNLIRGILSDRPLCNRHGNTSFASHRWAAISPSWPKEPDSRTAARGQSSPDLSPWTTGLSLSGCSQPGKPSRFHCDREGLAQRKKTAFSLKSQEIFLGQLNQRGCYCLCVIGFKISRLAYLWMTIFKAQDAPSRVGLVNHDRRGPLQTQQPSVSSLLESCGSALIGCWE